MGKKYSKEKTRGEKEDSTCLIDSHIPFPKRTTNLQGKRRIIAMNGNNISKHHN